MGNVEVLVNIGDYKTMAKEICELLNPNSEKRKEYLENTNNAVERFNSKIVIKQIEKILEEL